MIKTPVFHEVPPLFPPIRFILQLTFVHQASRPENAFDISSSRSRVYPPSGSSPHPSRNTTNFTSQLMQWRHCSRLQAADTISYPSHLAFRNKSRQHVPSLDTSKLINSSYGREPDVSTLIWSVRSLHLEFSGRFASAHAPNQLPDSCDHQPPSRTSIPGKRKQQRHPTDPPLPVAPFLSPVHFPLVPWILLSR